MRYHDREASFTTYPIRENECLYARGVPVLMSSEASGYRALWPHLDLSFVACPAIKMPTLHNMALSAADAGVLAAKVRLILDVASREGHEDVVLGAMGCGVWGCPAKCVARVMHSVIASYKSSVLKRVHFAITGRSFDVFRDAFDVERDDARATEHAAHEASTKQ
jgi:uncharacterized protein (TIGR02452 family)